MGKQLGVGTKRWNESSLARAGDGICLCWCHRWTSDVYRLNQNMEYKKSCGLWDYINPTGYSGRAIIAPMEFLFHRFQSFCYFSSVLFPPKPSYEIDLNRELYN